MTNKRFIFILLFLACMASAFAQDASFELIRPQNVVEGRNFAITFRVSNGEANPPSAPSLEHCTLLFGPSTSTMHSAQYINGKMTSSSSVDYTFTYRADSPGTVNVPEVSVTVDGKAMRSRAASFKILPSDAPRSGNSGSQTQSRQGSATDIPVSADDMLVRVSFSKSSVYEQEPVVATIKVYTKYDITSFLPTVQPAFEGFLSEELPVDNEISLEHYNGQNYHSIAVKRLLLYPQKAGKLSVNSGKYDVTLVKYETVNMGFFQTQRPVERSITTSSNVASIVVKPLPEPRPAGFNGAVGRYSVETSLEPEILRTNEAAVYSYIIKGRGNIKYLNEPAVQFPAGIDAYTPKSEVDAHITADGTNLTGTYTTLFTFVPQEVGNFEIEGTPFVYFNPETSKYETVDVADMPIRVLRGNNVPGVAQQQTEINKVIDDILHIKPTREEDQSHVISYTYQSSAYWLAYILVILILIGVIVVYRRNIRLKADVAGQKLAKASRVAVKRLKIARQHLQKHEYDQYYAALSKSLWGYISDKLNIAPSQLTRENVAQKLSEYGLQTEGIDNMLSVLDGCEMARFTPMADSEATELYSRAESAIKSVEDIKKR
ncbi:MAG: BatD family protein [Muribaculaceae bacterium]|nr:BatD family protein [Muribaculaceae bacterium]